VKPDDPDLFGDGDEPFAEGAWSGSPEHRGHPSTPPEGPSEATGDLPMVAIPVPVRRNAATGGRRRRRGVRRSPAPETVPRRRRQRSGSELRRIRRLVALGMVLIATSVTLGSALRDDGPSVPDPTRGGPAPAAALIPSGPPLPLKLASRGPVVLYVPIASPRVTAIDYHAVDGTRALDLAPSGRMLNAGLLDRIERQIIGASAGGPSYYVSGGSTQSVDVGAAAGTQLYAPVTGVVVGITPYILNGRAWGAVVTIQPLGDPTVVVVVSGVAPDPTLRVGSEVSAQTPTLMGTVVDLSPVLKMDISQYTADAGNHVHIEVRPAEVLAIP
jgi:hypothetical protein